MAKFILPLFLFFSFLAFSCKKEVSEKKEIIPQSYITKLNLAGEITVSESPLLGKGGPNTIPRSVTSDDLIGFDIKTRKIGESKYDNYAYGLFDNINNLEITTLEGYQYSI